MFVKEQYFLIRLYQAPAKILVLKLKRIFYFSVPTSLYNFSEFCSAKCLFEEEGATAAEAKKFLQALVVNLRADAGPSFDYDNDMIQLSYILHPFFRGNLVKQVHSNHFKFLGLFCLNI